MFRLRNETRTEDVSSEHRIDERGQPGAGQQHQEAEEQQEDDDGQHPPLLVRFQERPQLADESTAGLFSGGFKFARFIFLHGSQAAVTPAVNIVSGIDLARFVRGAASKDSHDRAVVSIVECRDRAGA